MLADNLQQVQAKIAEALQLRKDKDLVTGDSVTLVAVTKNHPPEIITDIEALGIANVGENRVQELMSKNILNVHRHHTIGHVLEEMNVQGISRALVYEDNRTPVGIVTRSGLTFSDIMGPKDDMETKNIKMTRKESTAGRKQNRYIRQMPFVAEDVMTSPILTMIPETKAVEASRTLAEKHIIGMPVVMDDEVVGYFSADEIIAEIGRWK